MKHQTRKLLVALCLLAIGIANVMGSHLISKRQSKPDASGAGADLLGKILGTYLDTLVKPETNGSFWDGNKECGYQGGCHKGFCWSFCDATAINGEWCYTTKGRSQDFNYVECSRDDECNRCWKCAGSCTI